MSGRLTPVLAIAAASLLAAPFLSSSHSVEAQDPYKVLIADFFAEDGQDKGFGQRTASELRERVATVPGYATLERGEIQEEVRKYPDQLKMDTMDCIKTRQLGSLMGVRIAFCVSYTSEGENRAVKTVEVWDLWDQQSFTIPGFAVAKNEQEPAAQRIFEGFDGFIKQLQFTTFCQQYAQSQSWEDALRNCDQALALNAGNMAIVYMRANILREMGRHAESLQAVEKVIEADPLNDKALQMAGWLATQLNEPAKGRTFYRRYLELNPGDAQVRSTIAFEMYEAGDPEGAMQFIEEGLKAGTTEDVNLLIAHGMYAFQAADKAFRAGTVQDSELPPQVVELYRKAAGSFEKVFAAQAAQTDVSYLRNIVAAYLQLKQDADALRTAEQFLAIHGQDVLLLNSYATALERGQRIDDAIAALKRIEAADATFPNISLRQAKMLLDAGRLDEAIPALKSAAARPPAPAAGSVAVDPVAHVDAVARMLLADANERGMQQGREDWGYVQRVVEQAKEFPVSPELMQEFDFYLGYAVYQRAVSTQPARPAQPTVATARQALPMFRRARDLLISARPWGQRTNRTGTLNSLIEAASTYITIQEAVIQRG